MYFSVWNLGLLVRVSPPLELFPYFSDLTVARLESFIPQLLSRLFLEFLVYGNVTAQVGGETKIEALNKGNKLSYTRMNERHHSNGITSHRWAKIHEIE